MAAFVFWVVVGCLALVGVVEVLAIVVSQVRRRRRPVVTLPDAKLPEVRVGPAGGAKVIGRIGPAGAGARDA